jgi:hypothetical protein
MKIYERVCHTMSRKQCVFVITPVYPYNEENYPRELFSKYQVLSNAPDGSPKAYSTVSLALHSYLMTP